MIDIAKKVLLDKTSLVYAHLLNTEGVTYYEQNRLQEAREALEACLAIRELHLSPTDVEMANVLSNLGNIETAEGSLDTALEYLKNSLLIREGLGSGAEILLALNYMQLGRVHFLGGHYTLAYYHYQKCEDTLNVPVWSHERGRSKRFFMANLQYAYGNLDFVQGRFNSARKAFDQARQMSQEMTTVAPLTVAAYYKLGCIEFKHDHYKEALKYLSIALDIAEVRSPGVMDGTIARILWKKAEVMLEDPLADDGSATQLMADIEISQKAIADELGVDVTVVGADGDREKSFDLLVPGYFR
jgi:tetratricopeptide (TPR) repeat protein